MRAISSSDRGMDTPMPFVMAGPGVRCTPRQSYECARSEFRVTVMVIKVGRGKCVLVQAAPTGLRCLPRR